MRIPMMVLIRLIASAPAPSQARAMAAMSVTLGESLIHSGFFVTRRTRPVMRAAASGVVPKAMPPPWTLGQLMLISIQPTSGHASIFSTHWTYSSSEKPLMLAITGLRKHWRILGISSPITLSMPGFCRPMALIRPEGHSAMRGVGLP